MCVCECKSVRATMTLVGNQPNESKKKKLEKTMIFYSVHVVCFVLRSDEIVKKFVRLELVDVSRGETRLNIFVKVDS